MNQAQATALLSAAIAIAEGYPLTHAIAWRARNPGNLELPDQGFGLLAKKTIFESHLDGWTALERQTWRILTGEHSSYRPTMTLLEVAIRYTGHDHASEWAAIVAHITGLKPDDQIRNLLLLPPPTP